MNPELVNCYVVVRDHVDELLPLLKEHQKSHSKDHYYRMREMRPTQLDAAQRAARLIYLNKTCFNGLYRVNSDGCFDVPIGSYRQPSIFDEAGLCTATDALRGALIVHADFAEIEEYVSPGYFIYFEPPYYPISKPSSFTGYAVRPATLGRPGSNIFAVDEQQRLAVTFAKLAAGGGRAMLSNSDSPRIRTLFKGARIETVAARRAINCDGTKRGTINEIVVLSY